MALKDESFPTSSNCVPSNLTIISEAIPPICSAFGTKTSSVQELNFLCPISDSGISATSLSPESACIFQQPLVQNVRQEAYFANSNGNPKCAAFYPDSIEFLSYNPSAVNSAVPHNEMTQKTKCGPNRKRKTIR
ncbi:hypothetical protein AVEN_19317-1 [Araneus ventricosus]|uniref:Uncharacterized protein n=1 Tax=Araneus ventricosus TaxID=182803 RepID=A0A4Y2N7B7_ARAVE|nr:hypothetical protein AVEN_19317-1 [Araneus ventricosus]